MKNNLTVALLQQDIVWENPQANYSKVESAFCSALGDKGADILVAPETFTTGFGDHMARQAEEPQGPTFEFALSMARRFDALFAASWTVRENGAVFNRLHLVRPDGTYDSYDKAHTFRMSSEASQLQAGHSRIVAEWRGWHIKPAICYDIRFPVWLRNSPSLDYDILLVCANWPGSRYHAWTTLLKARAIENLAYSIGCNRIGTDGTGIPYAGCSAVIDYKGLPICQADPSLPSAAPGNWSDDMVLMATLDAEALKTFRQHWPFNLDFDSPTL